MPLLEMSIRETYMDSLTNSVKIYHRIKDLVWVTSLSPSEKDVNVKKQNALKNIANAIKAVFNALSFVGVKAASIIKIIQQILTHQTKLLIK
jgi:uncharacterized protein YjaG (DUF416 family)